MMTKASRWLLAAAALALALTYVLPLWTIDLEAPQYPEGLGMVIRIDAIEGQEPHHLGNINNLNHYIGMKRIVPESIPELKIMPGVVGLLILLGLGTAVLGRRRLLYAWTALFLLTSVVGLADFYKWEYDYGHDLDDENAIIKIPGMSYQPPLIGSKQILNFRAHSWPGSGGWIAIAVGALASGLTVYEFRRRQEDGGGDRDGLNSKGGDPDGRSSPTLVDRADGSVGSPPRAVAIIATVGALATNAAACSPPGPRALVAGVDACESCLMPVANDGHGAEVVTETGRILTFDSIECLVGWLQREGDGTPVRSAWVTDLEEPGSWIVADEAYYLGGATLPSPMGLGLHAFAREEDRDRARSEVGGSALDWMGVKGAVAEAWPDGRPRRGHGGHSETLGARRGTDHPGSGGSSIAPVS